MPLLGMDGDDLNGNECWSEDWSQLHGLPASGCKLELHLQPHHHHGDSGLDRRIAVADSVKIDSDKRAHARPVIAAGKSSGTVAAWRLGAHDSTSAEATWSARCHVQPVSGLAWCAAPEIELCAAVRLVSMHTTGAAVAYTVPTDPRAFWSRPPPDSCPARTRPARR